jgi:hypothetical protein
MQTNVLTPTTLAESVVPELNVAVGTIAASRLWILGGAAIGIMSGATMGLLGVLMWSAVSVAPFTAFVGARLVLGTAIPAVLGGMAVLIAAASADVSAEL